MLCLLCLVCLLAPCLSWPPCELTCHAGAAPAVSADLRCSLGSFCSDALKTAAIPLAAQDLAHQLTLPSYPLTPRSFFAWKELRKRSYCHFKTNNM